MRTLTTDSAALTRAPAGQAEPKWRDWGGKKKKKGDAYFYIQTYEMSVFFFVSFLCSPVL